MSSDTFKNLPKEIQEFIKDSVPKDRQNEIKVISLDTPEDEVMDHIFNVINSLDKSTAMGLIMFLLDLAVLGDLPKPPKNYEVFGLVTILLESLEKVKKSERDFKEGREESDSGKIKVAAPNIIQ